MPIFTLLRARRSRSLDELPDTLGASSPRVSVVIPARNEARNIVRCVESVLATRYPALEVIAVDDYSTDSTGDLLNRIAASDPRLRVIRPEPLPAGWFGKQWACTSGARVASGEILAFLDADTWQRDDLIPRAVNAMHDRRADFLTVAGAQEMESFWERMIQPQMFALFLARYGGTEIVNAARRADSKIANGQCIFMTRAAYDDLGGHGAVRDKVAEDLALAQLAFRAGKRTTLILGLDQLHTRMYTSFAELAAGWGKNVYAGGRDAMPFGALGQLLYPVALISPWVTALAPPLVLALAAFGIAKGALPWAAISTIATVIWWLGVYRWLKLPLFHALLYPFGAGAILYICLGSIVRGRNVQWKSREYVVT